jgi:hypothetical protein
VFIENLDVTSVVRRILSTNVSMRHRRKRGQWSGGDFGLYGQANKRIRWMPWQSEAMKDVAACEKCRGAGNKL